MVEVDLERLAAAYHLRSERGATERMAPVMEFAALGRGDLAVDVGGGRGAQAHAIAAATRSLVVVVDPSPAMVAEASRRGAVVVLGRGESLPFADASAGLVLFHLSIHHGDWRRMLDEAWRVVRPGGVVWVWTMAPDHLRRSQLARWFPRVGEIDAARFPAIDDLERRIAHHDGVPHRSAVSERVERTAAEWVAAVEAGFVSTLHLLEPAEIEQGIARFTAEHPDATAVVSYDIELTAVWSRRPPVES